MKLANANKIRAKYLEIIKEVFKEEDIDEIASNSINFPVVADDGEEGMVEIVVKIPKDSGDDGYMKREAYKMKCEERAQKAKERAESKAKKIAKDKARREKAKEEKGD